jgi:hypothetical protein
MSIGYSAVSFYRGVLRLSSGEDSFVFYNFGDDRNDRIIRGKSARIVSFIIILVYTLAIYLFYKTNNFIINNYVSNLITIVLGLFLGSYCFKQPK